MRLVLRRSKERRHKAGRWVIPIAFTLAALGAAAPATASKKLKEEFLIFSQCPVATAEICLYSNTTGGEFKIGLKTVPISKPVVLQGGADILFTDQPLQGAIDGNTLSRTPLEVPGGLVGIAGLGGEVTATAEIAGPVSGVMLNAPDLQDEKGTALTLPLKVKLDNPLLGEECYIGTDAEPIELHLTSGTTSPPFPNQPISGTIGTRAEAGKGKIVNDKGASLVDNSFSVPGATGCGGSASPIIDLAVDADVGLPAPAGLNTAIMSGELADTGANNVVKYLPKKKKKK
jgi:hypothetical protein